MCINLHPRQWHCEDLNATNDAEEFRHGIGVVAFLSDFLWISDSLIHVSVCHQQMGWSAWEVGLFFFPSRVTKTEDPPSAMYITKRFSFLTYSLSSLNGSQAILTFSTYHLAFTLPTQINAILRPIVFKTDTWIFIRRWKIVFHCSCGIFPWTMASPLVAFDSRPSYLSHSHPVFRSVDVICDQGKRPWISLIATWCAQR